ncbi:MAG TPA: NRDE family protein [Pseudomonadales bacterium]|jgi:uncharacterized protein with NRDE domain|nr:NRDE family protein [Pseudomonadales bacterium]
MCLILFAIAPNDGLKLVVAANRDEQHARPTLAANYWLDDPGTLGGRDLQAGGTWLGVTKSGRFAAVTNFAEEPPDPLPPRSRGDLTSDFLRRDISCRDYLAEVQHKDQEYRGFNLVISDGEVVFYYSNREKQIRQLPSGFYGLSNQLLDCNWPKVISARQHLMQCANNNFGNDTLFELLACRGDETPFSARFILGEHYGTCTSTIVKMTGTEVYFEERGFSAEGTHIATNQFEIALSRQLPQVLSE